MAQCWTKAYILEIIDKLVPDHRDTWLSFRYNLVSRYR